MTFREWWDAKVPAGQKRNALLAEAANKRLVSAARGLRDLSDDELIAKAEARTSMSHPYREMEMQRRLKDSIQALTTETAKARW
jgi:hypothetical protein